MPDHRPKAVQLKERSELVRTWLNSELFVEQVERSIPATLRLSPAPFLAAVWREVKRNPKLALCTPESFYGSILQAGGLGLTPGQMGECWILPYRNRDAHEAQFVLGYRGAVQLLYRSGLISGVRAEVVYTGDEFEFWEEASGTHLRHKPKLGYASERGERRAVWAALQIKGGGVVTKVRPIEYAYYVRDNFAGKNASGELPASSPWQFEPTGHFDQMACKTLVKLAAKFGPCSTETQLAISLDDQADQQLPQTFDVPLADYDYADAPPEIEEPEPEREPERDPQTGEIIPDSVGANQ